MAARNSDGLMHSVAFRVTEAQWKSLQQVAQSQMTTVPQLAKQILFEQAGLEIEPLKRQAYGQIRRKKSNVRK